MSNYENVKSFTSNMILNIPNTNIPNINERSTTAFCRFKDSPGLTPLA